MNTETASWLRKFYSDPSSDAETPGDDLGTTYGLCGAILLAAAHSGSRSPEELAEATGLPLTFVAIAIGIIDYMKLWHSESFNELCRTVRYNSADHPDVLDALHCFLEQYWDPCKFPGMVEILVAFRGAALLFGRTQSWIHADPTEHLMRPNLGY